MKGIFILVLACGLVATLSANPFLKSAPNPDTAGSTVQASPETPRQASGKAGPAWLADLQLGFRAEAGALLQDYKTQGNAAILGAILLSTFLYGLFHALGPGHRKTVVFSLFLGSGSPWWHPLAAGFLSGGIHGLSSIGIIVLLLGIRSGLSLMVDADAAAAWVELGAGWILFAMALGLLVHKILHWTHHHNQRTQGGKWAIIATTSLVPCPGATMVLLLSLYLDVLALGVLAVVSMSLGMGLVVSASAYLAWGGRTVLFSRLKARESSVHLVSNILELLAYATLLVLAAFSLFFALS